MKKVFFIVLILTISIYMTACNDNPYIGQYVSPNNTILRLDPNNNCTIINNLYKGPFYIKGKYVIKGNKINITFDSYEPNNYGVSSLTGEFEGSRINIYNSLDSKYYIYSKE
jgi:hypothetical protein